MASPRRMDDFEAFSPLQSFFVSIVICSISYYFAPRHWPAQHRTLVPSTLHAILSSLFSAFTWVDIWDDLLAGSTSLWLLRRNYELCVCAFTCGYIVFDTCLCAYVDLIAPQQQQQHQHQHASSSATAAVGGGGSGTSAITTNTTTASSGAGGGAISSSSNNNNSNNKKEKPLLGRDMLAHHGIAFYTTGCALFGGIGAPLQCLCILSEVSTPFVNAHHILPADSPLRLPNGLAMFIAFGTVRIGLLSLVARALVLTFVPEIYEVNPITYFSQVFAGIVLFSLNYWWFSRITLGLIKKIRGGSSGSSGGSSGSSNSRDRSASSSNNNNINNNNNNNNGSLSSFHNSKKIASTLDIAASAAAAGGGGNNNNDDDDHEDSETTPALSSFLSSSSSFTDGHGVMRRDVESHNSDGGNSGSGASSDISMGRGGMMNNNNNSMMSDIMSHGSSSTGIGIGSSNSSPASSGTLTPESRSSVKRRAAI